MECEITETCFNRDVHLSFLTARVSA